MSMSAHVTMRRQCRQDETTEELPENFSKVIIRSRVHARRRLTATLSPTNQKAESKGNRWHPRDLIAVCAVQTRPSTESGTLHTNQIRTCFISLSQGCSNVVCPSFTQSARFLHTGQLITRHRHVEYIVTCYNHDKLHAHVIRKCVREHVQVRCSVLVGSDLPHLLIDVRQIAASVKVPGVYDEPLEES